MDPGTRSAFIVRYRQGPHVMALAAAGLSEHELDARPADGGWSARQIIHHVADSELTSAIRLRRLLAEDEPAIQGYDEEAFARALFYDRPVDASLRAIAAARETCAELLDRLSEAQWRRTGTHSESGAYSVETWLEIYAAHCHDHAHQLERAARGGTP